MLAKCKLCDEQQMLAHILNCCQAALNSRHYNEHHDEVLSAIATLLREEIGEDFMVMTDIGPEQSYLSLLTWLPLTFVLIWLCLVIFRSQLSS